VLAGTSGGALLARRRQIGGGNRAVARWSATACAWMRLLYQGFKLLELLRRELRADFLRTSCMAFRTSGRLSSKDEHFLPVRRPIFWMALCCSEVSLSVFVELFQKLLAQHLWLARPGGILRIMRVVLTRVGREFGSAMAVWWVLNEGRRNVEPAGHQP